MTEHQCDNNPQIDFLQIKWIFSQLLIHTTMAIHLAAVVLIKRNQNTKYESKDKKSWGPKIQKIIPFLSLLIFTSIKPIKNNNASQ